MILEFLIVGGALSEALCVWVLSVHRSRWTKGRVVSAPLARMLRTTPYNLRSWMIAVQGLCCLASMVGLIGTGQPMMFAFGGAGLILMGGIPALDDYVTGDDDRWKRFGDWVRNKVKWRMLLPAPRLSSGTACTHFPSSPVASIRDPYSWSL